jgi:Rho-binding antiterminator
MENYEPISCDFYDELEAFSILKKEVEIFYEDESGEAVSVFGKIKDLYSRDKQEYLLLDSGIEIRLDSLVRVDNKILADY